CLLLRLRHRRGLLCLRVGGIETCLGTTLSAHCKLGNPITYVLQFSFPLSRGRMPSNSVGRDATGQGMAAEISEKQADDLRFSPVKAVLRHQSIIDQIMGLIETGALHVGDKFPPERALADRWQVSRPVLREAFRVLQAQGIVESRHGDGRYVRASRPLDA